MPMSTLKTCLVQLNVGDKVGHYDTEEIGIIRAIQLVPNGRDKPELVAVLEVEFPSGRYTKSTSEKYYALADQVYKECFPSLVVGRKEIE